MRHGSGDDRPRVGKVSGERLFQGIKFNLYLTQRDQLNLSSGLPGYDMYLFICLVMDAVVSLSLPWGQAMDAKYEVPGAGSQGSMPLVP